MFQQYYFTKGIFRLIYLFALLALFPQITNTFIGFLLSLGAFLFGIVLVRDERAKGAVTWLMLFVALCWLVRTSYLLYHKGIQDYTMEFILLCAFLGLGFIIWIFRRNKFTIKMESSFNINWPLALLGASCLLGIAIVAELMIESLPSGSGLFASLIIILPLLGISLRRFAIYTPPPSRGILVTQIAKKLIGHSEQDIIAGVLCALSVLTDRLDNRQHQNVDQISTKLLREFPEADPYWLKESAGMAVEVTQSANLETELLSLAEFYASLLAGSSSSMSARRKNVDWSMAFLLQILLYDGSLSQKESITFRKIYSHFSISSKQQEEFWRKARYQKETSTEQPIDEKSSARQLFGLSASYTREELDMAWKKIAKTSHPDRFHFADPGMMQKVHEQFIKYKKAYDLLKA